MSRNKSENIGEISELYTIFRLAADGRLQQADVDFREIPEVFTEIKEIIRTGSDGTLSVILEDEVIRVCLDGIEKIIVTKGQMSDLAKITYNEMLTTKTYTEAEDFLSRIGCTQVKANSTTKTDIAIKVHDPRTGIDPTVRYSVKSDVGSRSTLYNATSGATLTYEIEGPMTEDLIGRINGFGNYDEVEDSEKATSVSGKVKKKFAYLLDKGYVLTFIQEDCPFHNNLMYVDSAFPKILAEMVLKYYSTKGLRKIDKITEEIEKENPIYVPEAIRCTYYEYKVKNFLVLAALGMTQGTPWDVRESVTGGIIVVKKEGTVVCYHLFDRNEFENHLFHMASIDTPSTGRHSDSSIHPNSDGKNVITVAMQIRMEQTCGEVRLDQ